MNCIVHHGPDKQLGLEQVTGDSLNIWSGFILTL